MFGYKANCICLTVVPKNIREKINYFSCNVVMDDIARGKHTSLYSKSVKHGIYNCDEYKQTGKLLSLTNATFSLSRKCAAQYEALLITF